MSTTGVEMRTLEDERVVVTGGSRGLGLGIVEALLARGAQVTVVARDPGARGNAFDRSALRDRCRLRLQG